MSKRWQRRLAIPGVLLLIAIGLLVPSTPGDTTFGIGWGIAGIAFVFLVAYAFLAVGESEDRDRAKQQEQRRR
jgi:hypothetical protein